MTTDVVPLHWRLERLRQLIREAEIRTIPALRAEITRDSEAELNAIERFLR